MVGVVLNQVREVSKSAGGSFLTSIDGCLVVCFFVGGLVTSVVVCVTPWRRQNAVLDTSPWPVCSVPLVAC